MITNQPPKPYFAKALKLADSEDLSAAGQLMVDTFKVFAPNAWPDLSAGIAEIRGLLEAGHFVNGIFDANRQLAGLIGGQALYDGHVWELHPLAVRSDCRGQGLGLWLVEDLAVRAKAAGASSLWVGTDDEVGWTNLGGKDLYPNPLDHLQRLKDTGGHPFVFYQRAKFVVTGVLPDANGPGKPDIFMTRKL